MKLLQREHHVAVVFVDNIPKLTVLCQGREREKERERQADRQTDRVTERVRDRDRVRQG